MYSTFFLGTLYLEHVRHYSALQTGAAFLPWTLTVAVLSQGITARLVKRFGPLARADRRHGERRRRTAAVQHRRAGHGVLPDGLLRLLRDRARHRQRVHAAADASRWRTSPPPTPGLAPGITNVSQQISGALGLAVLSTLAANHTKGLLSAHHGLTDSLIGGYHLAFLIGAAAIAAGIVLAFVLLRPRRSEAELRLAESPADGDVEALPTNLEIERNAA